MVPGILRFVAHGEVAAEIRAANDADRDAVCTLMLAQFREHHIDLGPGEITRAIDGVLRRPTRGRLLVATFAERCVGFAALSFLWSFEHGGRAAWLEELYVEPSCRGHGIGQALLRAAYSVAAAGGAAALDLEVDAAHQRVERLYAREGFVRLDRTRWARALPLGIDKQSARAIEEWMGGCFCGVVRYQAGTLPIEVTHCHCTICRRTTGAPFVTWATFPVAAFSFTAGTPAELRATPRAVRTLCSICGTALTFREFARPHCIDITVGSLDHPDDATPQEHTWTADQLAWLHIDDDLPRFSQANSVESDCTRPAVVTDVAGAGRIAG